MCIINGCFSDRVFAHALCEMHYRRQHRHGSAHIVLKVANGTYTGLTCSVEGCSKSVRTKNLCNMHYLRLWRIGEIGPAEPLYADDGLGSEVYLRTTVEGKSRLQHHLVVEKAMGKRLPKEAEVHHWNGDGKDNRPCNLLVCPDRDYHVLIQRRQKEVSYLGPPRLPPTKSDLFWQKFNATI